VELGVDVCVCVCMCVCVSPTACLLAWCERVCVGAWWVHAVRMRAHERCFSDWLVVLPLLVCAVCIFLCVISAGYEDSQKVKRRAFMAECHWHCGRNNT
jgi:hypothetical protein